MTIQYKSLVRGTPAAASAEASLHYKSKLAYETDPSDVYHDLQHNVADFVIVDVRSTEAYAQSHIPGAINIPHAHINAKRLEAFPRNTLFITYCWGPGCNGSTKGALRFSELGYAVKEMIGGLEYWEREGYPVEKGEIEPAQG